MTLFGNGKKNSRAVIVEPNPIPKSISLRDLVPNNEKLYEAMQTFLLGDPKRQLPLLGSTDSLLIKGDQEKSSGDNSRARFDYETAAKIELYRRNKETFEKFLRLASSVTENGDRDKAFLETLIANEDEALRISKEYYGKKSL
jgi:hypothetical protein